MLAGSTSIGSKARVLIILIRNLAASAAWRCSGCCGAISPLLPCRGLAVPPVGLTAPGSPRAQGQRGAQHWAAQSSPGGRNTGAMQTAPVLLRAINCCAAAPGCSGHRLLVSCAMGAVADGRFYTPCYTVWCLLPAGAAGRSLSLPLLQQASQGQTILGTQPERLPSKHHFFPVKGCVQPLQVTEQFPLCPAKRKQKERE